jgi:hypothetical protein
MLTNASRAWAGNTNCPHQRTTCKSAKPRAISQGVGAVTDAPNGYGIANGIPTGPDATNAIAFYHEVAGLLNDPWQSPSDTTVAGRSLGGGLAGFVGAIYGLHGDLFDNMPLNNTAYHAYADTFPGRNNGDIADHIEVPGNTALQAFIYGSTGAT